jgi:hypothetical protein
MEKELTPEESKQKPQWIRFNHDGSLKNPLRTFIKLLFSDDNLMPSSTRVIGTWIFTFVSMAVGLLTGVLAKKIYTTTDAKIVESCMQGVKTLLWIYTTMLASALSMYGINVWKYIAQIQAGLFIPPVGSIGGLSGYGYGSSYGIGQYGMGQYRVGQYGYLSSPGTLAKGVADDSEEREPPAPKGKTPQAGIGSDD